MIWEQCSKPWDWNTSKRNVYVNLPYTSFQWSICLCSLSSYLLRTIISSSNKESVLESGYSFLKLTVACSLKSLFHIDLSLHFGRNLLKLLRLTFKLLSSCYLNSMTLAEQFSFQSRFLVRHITAVLISCT